MHPKQAYEQTITSKLEALPVPDMADAIWARIEAQLDLDMPTDDGGGEGPSAPSGGGWAGKAGLFAMIAALVIAYFLWNRRVSTNSVSTAPSSIPVQTQGVPKLVTTGPAPDPVKSGLRPENNPPLSPSPTIPEDSSSAFILKNDPLPFVADSTQQQTALAHAQEKPKADTALKKKGRGISGISDDDYRIAPTKDSTRQKE